MSKLNEHKTFVLTSGGVDSTTALALAVNRSGADNVVALLANYGQRHRHCEMSYARTSAKLLGVEVHELDINMGVGGLTDEALEIPQVDYSDLEGVSPTYVPFRNGTLISQAVSYAHGVVGRSGRFSVVYGAHAEDAEGWAYPDCSPEFLESMKKAVEIGTYYRGTLDAPFITKTKAEIIALGATLGVNYKHTYSCYEGRALHCGVCPTCRARREAFIKAGVEDPTTYERG